MRTVIKYSVCCAVSWVLLLWLFCLPKDLFEAVNYSTVVEDCNGRLLGARIADDGQWRFPACDTLPEKFETALIEFEDRRFYQHYGVSIRSLSRAMLQNIRNGRVVSGGSTISMQVIRLSRGGDRNLWTKLVECFMATRLEARYSKDEILRMYASHAPFGGNVVGIDAALWRYLGSDECEMSWAEAATLAVLQNAPSVITPSKNRDALLAKRNRLLARLYEGGHMTEDECALAMDEPLIDQPYAMPQHAPHLVEWHNKHNHGEKVRTHIDLDLQRQVDDVITRWSHELRLCGAHDLAAVIIDVKTGEPVAYCGNADMDYERAGRWVDIARSPRSSGSILKPLLYCAVLQEGQILPQMLLSDIPTDFGGFAPKNYNGTFQGAVPADDAIAQSLNVPCVGMLKDYGVMKFVETLKDCGITTFNASEYGLSVILGGAEVNLLEITKLYADMAASYQAVDSTANGSFPLNDKVALYHTFEAMRKVNRPDQLDWRRVCSVQNVAWKTGTSYGSRDAWAIGLTPDYAVGVWVGNADGSGTPNLTGARTAGPVMFDLIGLLPFSHWFDEPEAHGMDIVVCKCSGHRAGRNCTETVRVKAPAAASSTQLCPYCHPVHLSMDRKHRILDRSEQIQVVNLFTLPTSMEHYYKEIHPEYVPLPPVMESQHQSNYQESSMKFLYPTEGSIIRIPRQLDGSEGKLTCSVANSDPDVELFWHCDGNFLGTTRDIHTISLPLQPGWHSISVVDSKGQISQVKLQVI